MRFVPLIVLGVLLAGGLALAEPPPQRVLVLGDSLANGAFATSVEARYTSLLATSERVVTVVPVRDLPMAWFGWLQQSGHSWNVVVIEIGINDTLTGPADAAWIAEYASFTRAIAATGARVVCATPFDIGLPAFAEDLAARAAAIRQACAGTVADLYAMSLGRAELRARVGDPTFYNGIATTATDDIHPNNAGHVAIAALLDRTMRLWHRAWMPMLATS
jgi:lysophospholipase L1-like esterase